MDEEGATVPTDFRYCTFSFCVCVVCTYMYVCVCMSHVYDSTQRLMSGVSLQRSSTLLFQAGSLSQTQSSWSALGSLRLPFKAGITVDRLPHPPGL